MDTLLVKRWRRLACVRVDKTFMPSMNMYDDVYIPNCHAYDKD